MITTSDSRFTVDLEKYYLILNKSSDFEKLNQKGIKYKCVEDDFSYSSDKNKDFLTVEEIRDLIINNIDKNFSPVM